MSRDQIQRISRLIGRCADRFRNAGDNDNARAAGRAARAIALAGDLEIAEAIRAVLMRRWLMLRPIEGGASGPGYADSGGVITPPPPEIITRPLQPDTGRQVQLGSDIPISSETAKIDQQTREILDHPPLPPLPEQGPRPADQASHPKQDPTIPPEVKVSDETARGTAGSDVKDDKTQPVMRPRQPTDQPLERDDHRDTEEHDPEDKKTEIMSEGPGQKLPTEEPPL